MRERELEVEFELDPALPTAGALLAFLRREAEVLGEAYDEDGTGHFVVRIEERHLKKLDELQNGIDIGSSSGRHKLQTGSGRHRRVGRGDGASSSTGNGTGNKRLRVRQGQLPRPSGDGAINADYEPVTSPLSRREA